MLALILFLILVYVTLGIIGFVVKGLFWLFVVAGVLFLITLFAVAAVAAHVELTVRTGAARHRIRSTNHARYQIASGEPRTDGRRAYPAERLMAQDQPITTRRCPAVFPRSEFPIRPAYPHREAIYQQVVLTR